MKRFFLLLALAACTPSSSSGDTPAPTASPAAASASAAPIPSTSAAPSVSAAPAPTSTAKPTAPAPSALSFCKASVTSEPLAALCAIGQDWSKAHFECAKPLPVNFCADLSVYGCQYVASAGEKAPKVSFAARFVRGGVALREGEMIDDNSLRARFPRAGTTRGVTVNTQVGGPDEAAKVTAAQTKKLVDAGCVATSSTVDGSTTNRLECGGWQAKVWYDKSIFSIVVDADAPSTPDCTK